MNVWNAVASLTLATCAEDCIVDSTSIEVEVGGVVFGTVVEKVNQLGYANILKEKHFFDGNINGTYSNKMHIFSFIRSIL